MRRFVIGFAVTCVVAGQGLAATSVASAATIPTLSIGSTSIQEGDAGSLLLKVPMTLSAPTTTAVTVSYRVVGGTAQAGTDFAATSGKVSFAAGVVEKPVSVTINSDTAVEPKESVRVEVTSLTTNAKMGVVGTVDIVDDDANGLPAKPEVSVGGVSMVEGDTTNRPALVPVTLSSPATTAVSVSFNMDCAALSSSDYAPLRATVKFPIGTRVKMLSVTTIPDKVREATESADTAGAVTKGTASAGVDGSLSIVDDDGPATGPPPPPPTGVRRVSEPASGAEPTFPPEQMDRTCGAGLPMSRDASVTEDGRYVVFRSTATNLVPADTNNADDIFVKDTTTGAIERVSVAADGSQTTGMVGFTPISVDPSITPDGRYVVFRSTANNLTPDATRMQMNAYIVDRVAHTFEPVQAGALTGWAYLSDDGRYVAFTSSNTLVPGDIDPYEDTDSNPLTPPACVCQDVFVKDRVTNIVTQLTNSPVPGAPGYGNVIGMSGDGSTIVYESSSKYGAIIPGDTNPTGNGLGLYAVNRVTGVIDKVDVNTAGDSAQGAFGHLPGPVSITTDGRLVQFAAAVCNLGVSCAPNSSPLHQLYVRDRVAHTTTLESRDAAGNPATQGVMFGSLSRNGRYLVYKTPGPSFMTSFGFPACFESVVLRDRVLGTTQRVGVPLDGGCGIGSWNPEADYYPNVSPGGQVTSDGRFVVFGSDASNLTPTDLDGGGDIFLDVRS
jgi:hypothetical protein